MTKSSLFKTIMKKDESASQRNREQEIQLHLLKGSLENIRKEQEGYLMNFEKMAEEFVGKIDAMLD